MYGGGGPATPEEALGALHQQTLALARLVAAGGADPAVVATVRADVMQRSVALLHAAPVFAARSSVHASYLWKHTVHGPVSELRAALRRAGHPGGGGGASRSASGKAAEQAVLRPEYVALARRLQDTVGSASRTLGGVLAVFLGLLGVGDAAAGAPPPLSVPDAKAACTAGCALFVYLGDLTRYAAEYPSPMHAIRVTPASGLSELWETALGAYVQAALLEPKAGHPHNQLAIVAGEARCAPVAALRFMRADACGVPFDGVRQKLASVFEISRQAYEGLSGDPRVARMGSISPSHLVEDAYLCVVSASGWLAEGVLGRRHGSGGGAPPGRSRRVHLHGAALGAGAGAGGAALQQPSLHVALVPRGHPVVQAAAESRAGASLAPHLHPVAAADGNLYYNNAQQPPAASSSSAAAAQHTLLGLVAVAQQQQQQQPAPGDPLYLLLRGSVLERSWEAASASTTFPPLAVCLGSSSSSRSGGAAPASQPARPAVPLRRALLSLTSERVLRIAGMLSLGTDLDDLPLMGRELTRDLTRIIGAAGMEAERRGAGAPTAATHTVTAARVPLPPPSGPILPAGFLLRQVTVLLWAASESFAAAPAPAAAPPPPPPQQPAGAAYIADDTLVSRRLAVRASFARYVLLLFTAAVAKAASRLLTRPPHRSRSLHCGRRQRGSSQRQAPRAAGAHEKGSRGAPAASAYADAPTAAARAAADAAAEALGASHSAAAVGRTEAGGTAPVEVDMAPPRSRARSRARRQSDHAVSESERGGDDSGSDSSCLDDDDDDDDNDGDVPASSGAAACPAHVLPVLSTCLAALGVLCDFFSHPSNASAYDGAIDAHMPAAAEQQQRPAPQQHAQAASTKPPAAKAALSGGRQPAKGRPAAAAKASSSSSAALAGGDPAKLLSHARRGCLDALARLANALVRCVAPAMAGSSVQVLQLLCSVVPGLADVSRVTPVDVYPHVAAAVAARAAADAGAPPLHAPAPVEFARPALLEELELRGFGVHPLPPLYDRLPMPYAPTPTHTRLGAALTRALPSEVTALLAAREGASYCARDEPLDFEPASSARPVRPGCVAPYGPAEALGVRLVKVLRLANALAARAECALRRDSATGAFVTSTQPASGARGGGGGGGGQRHEPRSGRRGSGGGQAVAAAPPSAVPAAAGGRRAATGTAAAALGPRAAASSSGSSAAPLARAAIGGGAESPPPEVAATLVTGARSRARAAAATPAAPSSGWPPSMMGAGAASSDGEVGEEALGGDAWPTASLPEHRLHYVPPQLREAALLSHAVAGAASTGAGGHMGSLEWLHQQHHHQHQQQSGAHAREAAVAATRALLPGMGAPVAIMPPRAPPKVDEGGGVDASMGPVLLQPLAAQPAGHGHGAAAPSWLGGVGELALEHDDEDAEGMLLPAGLLLHPAGGGGGGGGSGGGGSGSGGGGGERAGGASLL